MIETPPTNLSKIWWVNQSFKFKIPSSSSIIIVELCEIVKALHFVYSTMVLKSCNHSKVHFILDYNLDLGVLSGRKFKDMI